MERPQASTLSDTASTVMSSPVRVIAPTATVKEAHSLLLRYGHSGLCVAEGDRTLRGILTRQDIETALRHGFGHSTVTGFMSCDVKCVQPTTPLTQVLPLMLTYDVGRIPVVESDRLVGIVTRTDLLRCQRGKPPCLQAENQPSDIQLPASETLSQQLAKRLPYAWPVLRQLAEVAEENGWSLFVVGGAVRDLLISLLTKKSTEQITPALLSDIDLVVEGAGEGAGVALAEAIQAQHPAVSLQVYGQFQTASLKWPEREENGAYQGDALVIDIATARTEFYAYPAANPEVEASSLHQDLYRRDFTINAMAIRLSEGEAALPRGQLVDFFGGWLDLQKRQVTVLHNNSFIEDPTRIFRAVRFAARLGFEIEPQTQRLIRYAVSSGVYERSRTSEKKTPALQSRLTAELKYLFFEPSWEVALKNASQLGALSCIHESLIMTPALWRQLRRMNRWLGKLRSKAFIDKFGIESLANEPPKWLMLLELIIAQLEVPLRAQVSATLNLDSRSQRRLQNLHLWEADITQQLAAAKRPSQLSAALRRYERCELLLISDRHPYTLSSQIWQYITQISNQPSLITGQTLKELGYKPSPQFRKILTDVGDLALDGKLASVQEAQSYVLEHYPQQLPPKQ